MFEEYNENRNNYNDYRFSSDMGMNSHIPEAPDKNSGKNGKTPLWKKALTAAGLGLLFGAFAGAGLYGTSLVADSVRPASTETPSPAPSAGTVNNTIAATPAVVSANTAEDKSVLTTVTATVKSDQPVSGALDVSDVAESVMPAVVSITNSYVQTAQDIFGQQYRSESKAAGSGIIVGDNGGELLIVTNQHVVDGTDSLKVQFIDGSEYEANIKGEDESADLAVIAVDKGSLSAETKNSIKVASLGDSGSLKVGQTAIAIGNALGYGQSVTTGVISALDRELTLSNGTHKMIQTDAAINPGNSGGALVDINGNVIGINEAKLANSAVEAMGYAIPISDARSIIDGLMNQSTKTKATEDTRGYLGISGVDVTSEISEQYNMPRGVYIAKVDSGLAADNAGLTEKCIITALDGQSIQTMEQLKSLLSYYRIGDTIKVTIQQPVSDGYGYEEKVVDLTLGGNVSMTSNSAQGADNGSFNEEESGEEEPEEDGRYYYGGLEDIFGNLW